MPTCPQVRVLMFHSLRRSTNLAKFAPPVARVGRCSFCKMFTKGFLVVVLLFLLTELCLGTVLQKFPNPFLVVLCLPLIPVISGGLVLLVLCARRLLRPLLLLPLPQASRLVLHAAAALLLCERRFRRQRSMDGPSPPRSSPAHAVMETGSAAAAMDNKRSERASMSQSIGEDEVDEPWR
ncbi:hypothetical protein BRADI_2g57488v3 [Brachypodium distachyon]|uniref:Transmembrane protein n=1 Tax=Brachypodium distachyon TaxID=15368 RepID=A0A2K2DGF4_BRADI|nr:hypothetical protein BRADI_2g57488v3 [Brachypodium distachyon]